MSRFDKISEAPELEENLAPQRRQVLAGLKEETWPALKNDSKKPASADTMAANTRQLTGEATSLSIAAPPPTKPSPAAASTSSGPTAPETSLIPATAATAKSITVSDAELPESMESATMAEILLYRLGIRDDRDRVLEAEAKRSKPFELQQPVTPEKIAAAIAQVSIALLNHDLSPLEANTMLFALQTMLTAVRMSILADTIQQRRPTNKTEEQCQPKAQYRSQRSKASGSGRNSGSRSGSPATTTSCSPKSRSGSSARGKSSPTNSRRKKS